MDNVSYLIGDVFSEKRAHGYEEAAQGHICQSCIKKWESKLCLKAHLLDTAKCFWPLTRHYWFKFSYEVQCCFFCNEVFTNDRALKEHCFIKTACKLHYLKLYFRGNKSQNNSRSEHLNTENTSSSAPTSQRNATPLPCSSRFSNPSTQVRSNPNSPTSSGAEAAGETSNNWKCPYCLKSYEEKSSLKGHITRIHNNEGQWNRSRFRGNSSTAGVTQSTRREMLADWSHKGFVCGKCFTFGYTRHLFIAHVMSTRACLKYYENPKKHSSTQLTLLF
jgi:hypothetical protein